MFHEALSRTNLTDLPIVALFVFFGIFAIVSLRVLLRPKNDPTMEHLAALPLDDDVTPSGDASAPAGAASPSPSSSTRAEGASHE